MLLGSGGERLWPTSNDWGNWFHFCSAAGWDERGEPQKIHSHYIGLRNLTLRAENLVMERLIDLAIAFRKAIEASPKNKLPITFSSFPRGACGDATPLLGAFLIERGFEPFDYMLGWRASSSHAWLQRGNLVVDVTADQFADCDISVIVSDDSAWHRQFDGKRQHVADYRIYDERNKLILGHAYSVILSNLPSTVQLGNPRDAV